MVLTCFLCRCRNFENLLRRLDYNLNKCTCKAIHIFIFPVGDDYLNVLLLKGKEPSDPNGLWPRRLRPEIKVTGSRFNFQKKHRSVMMAVSGAREPFFFLVYFNIYTHVKFINRLVT